MAISREEIEQIAQATADEVMERKAADICKCVDWFLVATTAAEALEHNATVSDMANDLHENLKEIIPEKQLEDLEFRHVLLQGYITENLAEMALSGSLGSIRDKCSVDISDVKKLAASGFEAIRRRDPTIAAENFTKVKGELIKLADNICGRKESTPSAKEPWPELSTSEEGGISNVKLRELIDEVPDVDDPTAINYWKKVDDYWVYLEGWIDSCLISTGFPPMERGEWDAKINYMKDMTPITLALKAKEYNLKLIKGGFVENEKEFIEHLYGVTYGVYEKAE